MPWRLPEPDGSFNPYNILVSEIMLQQTQVRRVVPKYQEFLHRFPSVAALAKSNLGEVLAVWSGLGYNRRAIFLLSAAQKIMHEFDGIFPSERQQLESLPGIGPNTAGAIMAYAYDQPVVFIETNIRTVFIHHFFKDQTDIPDKDILGFVAASFPGVAEKERERLAQHSGSDVFRARRKEKSSGLSRAWYWALMDYGSFLKLTVGNLNRASKTYARQSKFAGSRRQLRGRIIRELLARPQSKVELDAEAGDARLDDVLADLVREGMVHIRSDDTFALSA